MAIDRYSFNYFRNFKIIIPNQNENKDYRLDT